MSITKTCEQCGEEYLTTRHTRRYCSKACSDESKKGMGKRTPGCAATATCKVCGISFSYYLSEKKNYKTFYCSAGCANLGKRTRITIQCRWCDKPFILTPSQFERGRRLCSLACRSAESADACHRFCEACGKPFDAKFPAQEKRTCSVECSYEIRRRREWVTCEICGKSRRVRKSIAPVTRYCSRKCSRIGQSKTMKDPRRNGPNHANWRGGKSRLPYGPEWSEALKAEIRKRDGKKCLECGVTSNLSVHHIDYDKMNCTHNNLITLCVSCNSKANFNRKHWQQRYTAMLVHSSST